MRIRRLPSARSVCYLGAAGLLTALGVVSLAYSGTSEPAAAPAASPPVSSSAPAPAAPRRSTPGSALRTPSSVPTTADPSATGSPAALVDGTEDASALQAALARTSAPDLPAATADELVRLAASRLTAQLRAAGTSAGLTIVAAIARRHDGRADLADVTVLYTEHDPAALEPQHRVVLSYALTPAGWVPVV